MEYLFVVFKVACVEVDNLTSQNDQIFLKFMMNYNFVVFWSILNFFKQIYRVKKIIIKISIMWPQLSSYFSLKIVWLFWCIRNWSQYNFAQVKAREIGGRRQGSWEDKRDQWAQEWAQKIRKGFESYWKQKACILLLPLMRQLVKVSVGYLTNMSQTCPVDGTISLNCEDLGIIFTQSYVQRIALCQIMCPSFYL